ncbi:MAG: CehA/McbA family metallohydrolase [Armatimonadetes bacterium]|nr:CehA/McbA family metallohydrolase [Armatimonadota bacterium]
MKISKFWAPLAISILLRLTPAKLATVSSHFEIFEVADWHNQEKCRIWVKIVDASAFANGKEIKIPARVIVKVSDGSYYDGSGRGVYRDGRFYADGEFIAEVPPGKTEISLSCGPNYIPLKIAVEAKPGKEMKIIAKLLKWFSPQDFGWFCGDNHVHVRHDPVGEIKMDEEYGALQARAEGLDYITEADAKGQKEIEEKLSKTWFLYRQAAEIRPGCFVGHANTPGINRQLYREELAKIMKSVFPMQTLREIVHNLGGIVIYTHPFPAPRLHWMGSVECLSDAITGNYADAFDISNRPEEIIWFTLLNLGAKIAASGSTDAALVRKGTIPPGARRVYAYSGKLDYRAIVDAIRSGRTFVTNGGPIFTFFTINGKGVGETISFSGDGKFSANITIFHLNPLRSAELIRNGKVIQKFSQNASTSKTIFVHDFVEKEDAWYVARAEDIMGNWAITSPIYLNSGREVKPSTACLIALQIGNFTRLTELRRNFFAHIIVTVSQTTIEKVALLRDGNVICEFNPQNGNYTPSGKIPVIELGGEYSEGWIWHPKPEQCFHFLADFPVKASGWYKVEVVTKGSCIFQSEEIYFDENNPNSHQISALSLKSQAIVLRLRGYGEEMPLNEIKIPFVGDHWWYPKNSFWELEAIFTDAKHHFASGWMKAREKFKSSDYKSEG